MRLKYDRVDMLIIVGAVAVLVIGLMLALNHEYLAAAANGMVALVAGTIPWLARSSFNRGFLAGHHDCLEQLLKIETDFLSTRHIQSFVAHEKARVMREYLGVE